jgi:hypothetical protein
MRRMIEEDTGKVEKTWKEVGALAQNRIHCRCFVEPIETGGKTLLIFTNPLIIFGIRKSLLYQFTERVMKLAV